MLVPDVAARGVVLAPMKPDSRLARNGLRNGIIAVMMLVTCTTCPHTTIRQMELSRFVFEERA